MAPSLALDLGGVLGPAAVVGYTSLQTHALGLFAGLPTSRSGESRLLPVSIALVYHRTENSALLQCQGNEVNS